MAQKKYLIWVRADAIKGGVVALESSPEVQNHLQLAKDAVQKEDGIVAGSYLEITHPTRLKKFPQLHKMLQRAQQEGAHIMLQAIGNLLTNTAFTAPIMQAIQKDPDLLIHCVEQPSLTAGNFLEYVENAQAQRRQHGELIKAGLLRSKAKSGNPNAASVINQVNKPKIDNAVLFALILQPVIQDYMQRGLSQRKMVDRLNTEGFCAPEGGKWVLSQLQKVLTRVQVNMLALEHEKTLRGTQDENALQQLAEEWQSARIPCPLAKSWTSENVALIKERVEQLEAIHSVNRALLHLFPILTKYEPETLTEKIFAEELRAAGYV